MSSPLTPARIDQPPQFSEQLRHPLHLIENHQPLGMALKKQSRLRQAGPTRSRTWLGSSRPICRARLVLPT